MKKATRAFALALAVVASFGGAAWAANSCISPVSGDIYYVAYQNNPPGVEYIVRLGDRNLFLNATTKLTFPDVRAGDFASLFSGTAPNLWIGYFGVRNPGTRDGILSANGPKDQTQLDTSSMIGAAQQIDSWASGLPGFSNGVGSPCSLNAATFPGKVFGSYQDTLNAFAQGSIAQNLAWNVEIRLSDGSGLRTNSAKIRFYSGVSNPTTGTSSRGPVGYFKFYTDGTTEYWPDFDGDLLPDVAIGSDPEADKCRGVNSTNNTDADLDNRAVPCDCADNNATVWKAPGEVTSIVFSTKDAFGWTAPADAGGTAALTYDVFRGTQSGAGSAPTYSCFQPGLVTTSTTDITLPVLGGSPFFYLVRAANPCPGTSGKGTVGNGRSGGAPTTRTVPSCP